MTDRLSDGLVLNIDLSGVEETQANIAGLPADLELALTVAMNKSLALTEQQVTGRMGVGAHKRGLNTGAARSSINYQFLSPFPNLVGSVGSPLEYVPVIEYGRKPGGKFPPVDAIRLWVKRKLGVPEKEIDSVAFLVGRHIAKYGTEGVHMFKEGFEAAEPHIINLFNNAVRGATARAND